MYAFCSSDRKSLLHYIFLKYVPRITQQLFFKWNCIMGKIITTANTNINQSQIVGEIIWAMFPFLFYFILTQGHFFIDFREREERGENHQCEKETSIVCLHTHSDWGIEPTTQACALTRDQTHNSSVYETMLQPAEPYWPGWAMNLNYWVLFCFFLWIVPWHLRFLLW